MWTGVGEGSSGGTELPLLDFETRRQVISAHALSMTFSQELFADRNNWDHTPRGVIVDGLVCHTLAGHVYERGRELAGRSPGKVVELSIRQPPLNLSVVFEVISKFEVS